MIDTSPNFLLSRLSAAQSSSLALERIDLARGQELERPGKAVPYVYFPESGLVSVIAITGFRKIEVGMIGSEGMTGTSILLGSDLASNLLLMQSAGCAMRMPRQAFLASLDVPVLRALWLSYAHVLLTQASETSLANGTGSTLQRLARWIVMWNDRVGETAFAVTHDYIGVLLGVRRASVTVALHQLEGRELIRSRRSKIEVLDRAGLIGLAAGLYGAPEAEYRRLIG